MTPIEVQGQPVLWVKQQALSWFKDEPRIGLCHMVDNILLAKRQSLIDHPWDDALKVFEHWFYFYQGMVNGLRVAVSSDTSTVHKAAKSVAGYRNLRGRRYFFRLALKKSGFREIRIAKERPQKLLRGPQGPEDQGDP